MSSHDSTKKNEYKAQSIRVMEGLEAVRKRPAMYIGSTGPQGLHHLVYEIVDNSVDESLAGYCTNIVVLLHEDGSCSVEDNGRGIPTDIHPTEKVSAAEVVLTKLHAGGKFDKDSYKFSGGLHGVGVSVVNALSDWLDLTIWRDGAEYYMRFEKGKTVAPLKMVKPSDKRGTLVRFKPDASIFTETIDLNFETLSARLRELAFLNKGLTITIADERSAKKHTFYFEGGIVSFVDYINKKKTPIFPEIISYATEDETYGLELAMQYNDGYGEQMFSFVNNINTVEGGTHVSGFRSALTKICNKRAIAMGMIKGDDVFSSEDVREGLVCVLSMKVPEPQFEGQTKTKLGNNDVKGLVDSWISAFLDTYFEENPAVTKLLLQKAEVARRAREAAKKARELTRRKTVLESVILPGKLADCSSENPSECELFIVEGDSAGGSAKSARDRSNQAILPLRGKILNVEKARLDKILGNEEIKALISAIGCGIDKEFDIARLRYHKIILMTDADVDGSHICTLLLTFFFRYMRPLIEQGHLYIAQPPLYKAKIGKSEQYLRDDKALVQFLFDWAREHTVYSRNGATEEKSTWQIALDALLAYDRELNIVSTHAIIAPHYCHQLVVGLSHTPEVPTTTQELVAQLKKQMPHYTITVLEHQMPEAIDETVAPAKIETALQFTKLNTKWSVPLSFFGSKELQNLIKLYLETAQAETDNWSLQAEAKDNVITGSGLLTLLTAIKEIGKPYMYIQRYKGLGEMNPDQLGETAMDPKLRSMLQVSIEDALEADTWFSTLMGDDVEGRRSFIATYGQFAKNLDI